MTDSLDLTELGWDVSRLAEALETLARQANLVARTAPALNNLVRVPDPRAYTDPAARNLWIDLVAQHLGIEAEPVQAQYADVDAFVRGVAPAIIEIPASSLPDGASANPPSPNEKPPRFFVLVRAGDPVQLLAPDLSTRAIAPRLIRELLCRQVEAPFTATTDQVLVEAGVTPERRARVRQMILAHQLNTTRVAHGWILRLAPGVSGWQHLRHARVVPLTTLILGVSLLQQFLTIATWGILGGDALSGQGHFDWARLWAWALLVLTGIPLQMLTARASARLGTNVGSAFKTTLLSGALKLNPEEIRHEGTGQFLSRILDASTVEYGAIGNALAFIFAVLQIFTALSVLALGVGGWLSVGMLGGFILGALALGWESWRTYDQFIVAYRAMTNHLVERMVGYRTRIVQMDAAQWHAEEDVELARYTEFNERQARLNNWISVLPRAWMIAGIASVAWAIVAQTAPATQIAISLGGVMLAQQALGAIIANIHSFIALAQSWKQIQPLFTAAQRKNELGIMLSDLGSSPAAQAAPQSPAANQKTKIESPLIALREVSFRYHDRGRLALRNVTLDIATGERILIQGPSGGGKSTLAAVIAGLRVPESGLLLLRGYDRASVGLDVWRKRVVVAPQFHENHVFTGTFGFNLLMGRQWPPTDEDLTEALTLCNELGLGELLARMPSGMQQMVGDSGWQLSHGERSRLFIARALLQHADLLLLDESFAALDPANLARALACVLRRAPALAVIAHP